MLQRIYIDEFSKEWDKAYENWYGKFNAKAVKPISEYQDGYSTVCFDPQEDFWFHVWNGPHCVFGAKELIPGFTLVTGCKAFPMFYSPKEFLEKFNFTFRCPFTRKLEPEGTRYHNALREIQRQIIANAK